MRVRIVVALWEAFYIENERFYLDTLRVPNRSPTPTWKTNDFLGPLDDIWGARGPHFRPILEGSGGPGRLEKHICFSTPKRPLRYAVVSIWGLEKQAPPPYSRGPKTGLR